MNLSTCASALRVGPIIGVAATILSRFDSGRKSPVACLGSRAISLAATPTSASAPGRTITRLWSVASGFVNTSFTGWPGRTANSCRVNSIRSGWQEISTVARFVRASNSASAFEGLGSLIAVACPSRLRSRGIGEAGSACQSRASGAERAAHAAA